MLEGQIGAVVVVVAVKELEVELGFSGGGSQPKIIKGFEMSCTGLG